MYNADDCNIKRKIKIVGNVINEEIACGDTLRLLVPFFMAATICNHAG